MPDLADLNHAPVEELRPRLLALTAAPRWADALVAARPYADLDALLDASDELLRSLEESQVDAALAGHPRIGESSEGLDQESVARSAGEQAGMADADTASRDAMARGNVAYEEKFGRIYLVAAAGRSADELLALLRERLKHDPAHELDVVRRELARITRLRLQDSWGGPVSISTHVLDAVAGGPAAGMAVRLVRLDNDRVIPLGEGITNADGRCPELTDGLALDTGVHRLRFETGPWFRRTGTVCFYPVVEIAFEVTDAQAHYHVPLLLSPFAYSTYRGS